MNEKKKLLGYYNYTVILTYIGMLAAFYGIIRAIANDFRGAIFCLLVAGVCDMFDGMVASTKTDRSASEKNFGIQIDSLSDLISFGVMPGIFVYMITERITAVGVISALFTLCALIRLAYFNILEEERQKVETTCRKSYLGVPVTTIALILPAAYLVYGSGAWEQVMLFPVVLFVTAVGFIIPVHIKKAETLGKILMILIGLVEFLGLIFFAH